MGGLSTINGSESQIVQIELTPTIPWDTSKTISYTIKNTSEKVSFIFNPENPSDLSILEDKSFTSFSKEDEIEPWKFNALLNGMRWTAILLIDELFILTQPQHVTFTWSRLDPDWFYCQDIAYIDRESHKHISAVFITDDEYINNPFTGTNHSKLTVYSKIKDREIYEWEMIGSDMSGNKKNITWNIVITKVEQIK